MNIKIWTRSLYCCLIYFLATFENTKTKSFKKRYFKIPKLQTFYSFSLNEVLKVPNFEILRLL